MVKHKDQRVGVFVDVQNLYYSAKNLYGQKVNFSNIMRQAVSGRQLIRAICYVINADIKGEVHFHDALEKIGYEVNAKDLQTFYGGAKKGDWDVGIAMDIMKLAGKLDVIVLVSGDGDFQELLEHVQSLGCRAEVIAFGKTASSKLKETADEFFDMDKQKGRFLIGGIIRPAYTKPGGVRPATIVAANETPIPIIEPVKVEEKPAVEAPQKKVTKKQTSRTKLKSIKKS